MPETNNSIQAVQHEQLSFYQNRIAPVINGLLVIALFLVWDFSTGVASINSLDASFYVRAVILVLMTFIASFYVSKRFSGSLKSLVRFIFGRQLLLLVFLFFIVYVLQILILFIYFPAVNFISCGLPFCV